jgi:hypothetical protein
MMFRYRKTEAIYTKSQPKWLSLVVAIEKETPTYTWWLIPLSKWVITPVINGISRVNPLITGVITHLLSGMSHQAVSSTRKKLRGSSDSPYLVSTLWIPLVTTNIAIENGSFIVHLPIKDVDFP